LASQQHSSEERYLSVTMADAANAAAVVATIPAADAQ